MEPVNRGTVEYRNAFNANSTDQQPSVARPLRSFRKWRRQAKAGRAAGRPAARRPAAWDSLQGAPASPRRGAGLRGPAAGPARCGQRTAEIGRANDCTPVTKEHTVCRILIE